MADDVVVRGTLVPENYQIFTENASAFTLKAVKMVQEAMEAPSYFDMEDSSCFSKCSADESNTGPTSHNFSSDFCVEKDDELPSCGSEDNCRKKRCSDRYDSAESSDSGIAVSSGASTSSGNSDITDPGSPFSTSSDDSSPAKSSAVGPEGPASPRMAPSAGDCAASMPAAAACPAPPPLSRTFPLRRTARAARPVETRAKRRVVRRPSSADTQGKITEYFKSQIKPMVGIKRDFNYLKKELFDREPTPVQPAKKPRDPVLVEKPAHDLPKLPLAFLRQRPPAAKTLFNKILHNHKQRKLVENFLKTRTEAKPIIGEQTQLKTEGALHVECGPGRVGPLGPKSPILTAPKTIRFPAAGGKIVPTEQLPCRWAECTKLCDASGPLLDHLQTSHVVTQGSGEKFVCLWVGCKVYDQKSCSRSWLERHVLTHAGNKPYRCIVDGCGQAFSSQSMLQRHVNHHFAADAKKALDMSGGQKLIRRNGKRIRFRRQPWSARSIDFFDEGMMERMEHRLIQVTMARTGGLLAETPAHSIALTSQVISCRTLPSGQKQFLLSWSPADVVEDEWVNASDVRPRRVIPFHQLPSATVAHLALSMGLVRRSRSGRKAKAEPPPPLPPPSPPPLQRIPRAPSPIFIEEVKPVVPRKPTATDKVSSSLVVPVVTREIEEVPVTDMDIGRCTALEKVKLKRKRSSSKLKSPIDPETLPLVKIPVMDIVKTRQRSMEALETVPSMSLHAAAPPPTPSTSFILNSQPFKLVSQPFLNAMLPMPVTYQLQPQLQPQLQQPLYFLPQTHAPMFQTIHISSNIVQQQSILTSLNLQKSPTLLLVNTTKQVNVSLTQERPKQKVQILPKPECLMPLHPS